MTIISTLRVSRWAAAGVLLGVLSMALVSGCDGRRSVASTQCIEKRVTALTGATEIPPAGLTPAEQAAIGELASSDGGTVCTGTLVGGGYVLTAAHCVHPELSQALLFHTTDGANDLRLLASTHWVHPNLDAMLLGLPIARGAFPDWIRPLQVVPDGDRAWIGTELVLSGFGDDEAGVAGVRRYVREPVIAEDSSWLVVDGGASHGACAKDSGGPLLSVADGTPAMLVGLLSEGSSTCRGKDRYLRASSLTDWLDATIATIEADPCTGVSFEGTCTDGQAKWCVGSVLESESCSGHQLCGWSSQDGGYRCLADDDDPCHGAGPDGICDGSVLTRCDRGTLLETDCATCGQRCVSGPRRAARCE
jgi:Trypsin